MPQQPKPHVIALGVSVVMHVPPDPTRIDPIHIQNYSKPNFDKFVEIVKWSNDNKKNSFHRLELDSTSLPGYRRRLPILSIYINHSICIYLYQMKSSLG